MRLAPTHFVIVLPIFLFQLEEPGTFLLNGIPHLSDQADMGSKQILKAQPIYICENRFTNLCVVSRFTIEVIEPNMDVIDVHYEQYWAQDRALGTSIVTDAIQRQHH